MSSAAAPGAGSAADPDARSDASPVGTSDRPVTTLRGAGVEVEPGRARQLVLVGCLVVLAVTAVILLVAGIQKNAQADGLHQHGVEVAVTVTSCSGQLGGSGSNGAGYACKGTYSFDGRRYHQSIPGDSSPPGGFGDPGVVATDDPSLLSTPAVVARQQASWKVFIAPAFLFVAFAVILTVVVLLRRGGNG